MIILSPARSSGCSPAASPPSSRQRWTMDKVDQQGPRAYRIHGRSDRRRETAGRRHERRAGTEVVVDILFLQKRDAGSSPAGTAWDALTKPFPPKTASRRFRSTATSSSIPKWSLGTPCANLQPLWTRLYVACPLDAGRLEDLLRRPSTACRATFQGPPSSKTEAVRFRSTVAGRHRRRRGGHQGGQLSRPRGRARPDHRRRAPARRRPRRQGNGGNPRQTRPHHPQPDRHPRRRPRGSARASER